MLSRVVSVVSRVVSSGSNADALRFLELAEVDDDTSTVLEVELLVDLGVVSSDSSSEVLRFLDLVGVLNGSG